VKTDGFPRAPPVLNFEHFLSLKELQICDVSWQKETADRVVALARQRSIKLEIESAVLVDEAGRMIQENANLNDDDRGDDYNYSHDYDDNLERFGYYAYDTSYLDVSWEEMKRQEAEFPLPQDKFDLDSRSLNWLRRQRKQ
jgi:hypothetical protein